MKSNKSQTLSVTLLVINDEDNLKKCLNAVKSIADEIVVGIDDITIDNSLEVAKKFTTKVYKLPHQDNFHINKKLINEKATSDWVLSLDSDEFVTKELSSSIRDLLAGKSFGFDSWQSDLKRKLHKLLPVIFTPPQKLNAPAAAYYLPRKNFFLGRYLMHAGQYPDPITRLFQKNLAHWPGLDVHEQMVVDGNIGWMTGDLDHYATPKFSRYLVRENRYSSLAAQQLYEKKLSLNPLNFLSYMVVKPCVTFCSLFLRYRGFLDGFPGFVFSLFSAIHFQLTYMKLWELYTIKSR